MICKAKSITIYPIQNQMDKYYTVSYILTLLVSPQTPVTCIETGGCQYWLCIALVFKHNHAFIRITQWKERTEGVLSLQVFPPAPDSWFCRLSRLGQSVKHSSLEELASRYLIPLLIPYIQPLFICNTQLPMCGEMLNAHAGLKQSTYLNSLTDNSLVKHKQMTSLYKQWLVAYNTGCLVHAEGVPAPPGMSTGERQKKHAQKWKRLAWNEQRVI